MVMPAAPRMNQPRKIEARKAAAVNGRLSS